MPSPMPPCAASAPECGMLVNRRISVSLMPALMSQSLGQSARLRLKPPGPSYTHGSSSDCPYSASAGFGPGTASPAFGSAVFSTASLPHLAEPASADDSPLLPQPTRMAAAAIPSSVSHACRVNPLTALPPSLG